jgi:hypothetical protein
MSVAVHLFYSADSVHVGLYQQDAGSTINHMRTDKHLIDPGTPAGEIVDRVLKPIGPDQKMHIMRMVSHGNTGHMEFPRMEDPLLIGLEYQRFRNYFDPAARLELHGCGVASDTDIAKPGTDFRHPKASDAVPGKFAGYTNGRGLTFLRRVANVFGVQVVGAVDVQHVSANRWEYEGDTVTVFPGGKFQLDNALGRPYDLAAQQHAAADWLTRIDKMINEGQLDQSRSALKDLIRLYPKTLAADWAKTRLDSPNLKAPALYSDP